MYASLNDREGEKFYPNLEKDWSIKVFFAVIPNSVLYRTDHFQFDRL